MSTIVFIDTRGEKLPKAAQEAVTYASQLAGGPVTAVTFGDAQGLEVLGANGAAKVVVARGVKAVDGQQLTRLVCAVAEATSATTIVCVADATGKAVAPRIAARLKAGHVAGATGLPEDGRFRRNVFSGKARAFVVEPEVTINNQWSDRYTVIEVSGLDRPGLLYELTTAISKLNLNIASAQVATFGERARDVFFVTVLLGAQINAPTRQAAIKSALLHLLSQEAKVAQPAA